MRKRTAGYNKNDYGVLCKADGNCILHCIVKFVSFGSPIKQTEHQKNKINDFDLKRKFNFYFVYFARIRFFSFRQLRLNDEW